MIKKILQYIINYFGYIIISKKSNIKLVNTEELKNFNSNNFYQKSFKEGLLKSGNLKSGTLKKQTRVYSMIQLAKHCMSNYENDFVECGCWNGNTSYIIANLIQSNNKKINFHIFDSFEGLSKSTKNDGFFSRLDKNVQDVVSKKFISNYDFVKNNVLGNFDFCKIYKGWIPSRFSEIENKSFSFVHIDVDLYEPTLESLKFFFPKLNEGGIVICDDYNSSIWEGATLAWDEYFEDKKFTFFYEHPLGGCFIIK